MADQLTFTCEMCGGTFAEGWTDEEALAEAKKHFGKSVIKEEMATVCDDCYRRVNPELHPHLVEESVKELREARRSCEDAPPATN